MRMRATTYPAGWKVSGRRAREVMPAAMRALVRTVALAQESFMGRGSCHGGRACAIHPHHKSKKARSAKSAKGAKKNTKLILRSSRSLRTRFAFDTEVIPQE